MNKKIVNLISEYFYNECGLSKEDFEPESSLFISGLLDSIEVIQLITFLEKTFSIKINAFDVSLEGLDSVVKIVSYLEKKGALVCS